MVDFALSKQEQKIFDTAMEFSKKYIVPYARELEEADEFPWKLAQLMVVLPLHSWQIT